MWLASHWLSVQPITRDTRLDGDVRGSLPAQADNHLVAQLVHHQYRAGRHTAVHCHLLQLHLVRGLHRALIG
jgi:hypothetical protein